jgi:hypothetical protein
MKTSRVAMRAREPRARGLAVWLALVAILAQAVLFEYAIAGTEAMSGPSSQVAHHEHHDGAKNTQPRPKHSHHADCPFCLALSSHKATGTPPEAQLPTLLAGRALALPFAAGRLAPHRGPAHARSRSPPPPIAPTPD